MILGSYTASDLLTSLYYVVLFIPLLLAPGYLLAWIFDFLSFRSLSAGWRFLLSIPLSVAITPATIFWIGRISSWAGLYLVFSCCFLGFVALLAGLFGHEPPSKWFPSLGATPKFAIAAGLAWLVIAVGSLVDIQLGSRLYFSVVTNDYSVRTAITDAIVREGVSPSNPFYRLTGPVPLRYHYFWFLPCSLILRVSGLTTEARSTINASVVWCGWALIALVPLYLRFFLHYQDRALYLRSKLGVAFFAVTGLDILPALLGWMKGAAKADMEWWNVGQITSWMGSLLWVPHNTAALVGGLTALLLLADKGTANSIGKRIASGLVAGAAITSMVGGSVYVALVFAAFFAAWTFYLFARRNFSLVLPIVIAGLVSVALAIPYLMSLAGQSGGATFMKFSVRAFTLVDFLADHFHLSRGKNLLNLIFLPLQYFLELGVFAAVPAVYVWKWNRKRSYSENEITLFLLAVIPLLIATFFKSGVVPWSNDLGWRGFLPVQFVLLIWAANFFASRMEVSEPAPLLQFSDRNGLVWTSLIVLGVVSSFYGLFILRTHGILADMGICQPFFTKDRELGKLSFGLRQGYDRLHKLLPADAVIQSNPKWDVYDFFLGLYSHRATAMFNTTCGVEYGGSEQACIQMYPEVAAAFLQPSQYNKAEIERLARMIHAGTFVVYDLDPAWNSNAWPAELTPALQNQSMRAYLLNDNKMSRPQVSSR